MSKYPLATREDHDDFCITEGWVLVRGATGKPVAHHRTYELSLHDGRILRTRISRPVDRTQYRPSLWTHVLRDQLEVTAHEFWACAREHVVPSRSRPVQRDSPSLPLYVVDGLSKGGLSARDIASMTEEEAVERLHAMWRRIRGSDSDE
ncbi:cytotoxic translational repressor of toxin-antitoxin stability system [Kocuria sp.]|uniref:cytotoxic translational repressor of toxin-antitoxin stability system n=1 Tax=Kocuria sp. TaxID=1871328 RepID=UPI0026E05DA0|nr:cytotoxic translational repressor of toxin-antitoxin stability system [Kocuria sp.]MDO5618095.1 cytotoxic translational repressor of toxin-antitoxin stability system [Kocuria sp.]